MATLIDSYSESNKSSDYQIGMDSSYYMHYMAQSFVGNGQPMDSCKFYLKKSVTVYGNIYARLYSDNGSPHKPATLLATSDAVNINSLSTSYGLITFAFSGAQRVTLTNGTRYYISCEYDGDYADLYAGFDSTSPSHPEYCALYLNGWIDYTTYYDMCFYVYSETASSAIKTVLGLAKASVKTVGGLAKASVKTWEGLT